MMNNNLIPLSFTILGTNFDQVKPMISKTPKISYLPITSLPFIITGKNNQSIMLKLDHPISHCHSIQAVLFTQLNK